MRAVRLSLLLLSTAAACQSSKSDESKAPSAELAQASALPGAEPYDSELRARIAKAVAELGPGYEPRTRHKKEDGRAIYTNRLIFEPSPYLRQHAHNPVNWYSWGPEAFEAAVRLGRPIFLSIGYSTCHWCHVMEEESFEDPETARVLNENFIAIKVDREERPDIDSLYMQAVQAMGVSGGWPLNVWLTPERKPFYGGTYFPPDSATRPGRPGFVSVLKKLKESYDADPDKLLRSSERIVAAIDSLSSAKAGSNSVPGIESLHKAATHYQQRFDKVDGGLYSGARGNKFPSSLPVRFLLRYARRSGDSQYLHMATLTLDKMADGGMYDQVGGGFHRYSTDPRWLVPHFEKMLYDNALLAVSYLEAYQQTGKERYAQIVKDILAYLQRDMRAEEGGFYSASDADSLTPSGEREEGYYFTWTPAELEAALGAERAELLGAFYGVSAGGNFEGRSILHRKESAQDFAKARGLEPAAFEVELRAMREILRTKRNERPLPLRDDKVLLAWNGLAISAFARASLVFERGEGGALLDVAKKTSSFLLEKMRDGDGRLLRSYRGGRAHLRAYLDDYAFFIAGLLDLYEASADSRWLDEALRLDELMREHYEDEHGGYFVTADDHEALLTREKPVRDGAIPSGTSVAVLNLLRFHQLRGEASYLERATRAFKAYAGTLRSDPTALSEMLLALDFVHDRAKQVVLVSPKAGPDAALAELRAVHARHFLPNQVFVRVPEGEALEELKRLVPLVESKLAIGGTTTAFVCEDSQCALPTSDPGVFEKQLLAVDRFPAQADPPSPQKVPQ